MLLACAIALTACSGSVPGLLTDAGHSVAQAPGGSAGDPGADQLARPWTVTAAPAPALPAALAAAGCTAHPTGWVQAENRRPGNPLALPDGVNPGAGVLGYLDRQSANCGQSVQVHLQTTGRWGPQAVRLTAYRIGYYGGAGARTVWRSGPLEPSSPAAGDVVVTPGPHLLTPQWPVTTTVTIDRNWPPGFYLLVPTTVTQAPAGPAIPLVIRDDGGHEPLLVKASTLTWDAYDEWGGWSLYHGPGSSGSPGRARVVAVHRPLTGSGYRQMADMDLPVVRTAEQLAATSGTDVAYTTDVSVDADPGQLRQHAEIVSGGHSEYWTTAMYDGILDAAQAGVNLAFLGANNLWWHARLEGATPDGEPAQEVVYRVLGEDPEARTDPLSATVEWQAAPLRRDPASVLGESHAGIGVSGSLQVQNAPHWYLAGTGLSAGAVLPDVVGNEADGFNPLGHNPPHTQVFAAGVLTGSSGSTLVTNSYVSLPSGAAVFAAGTTDWACDPQGQCGGQTVPAAAARVVRQLTLNVLAALSAPFAGLTYPATPTDPASGARLIATLPAAARGTYGGHS